MPRLILLLLPWLLACGEAEAPPPPPDPEPVVARIVATLDEAARLDRDRKDAEAVAAWRRAHAVFERDLEPSLRLVLPDREVVETEYLFGRIRAEIEQARGSPQPVVRDLRDRLEAQIAALADEPAAT